MKKILLFCFFFLFLYSPSVLAVDDVCMGLCGRVKGIKGKAVTKCYANGPCVNFGISSDQCKDCRTCDEGRGWANAQFCVDTKCEGACDCHDECDPDNSTPSACSNCNRSCNACQLRERSGCEEAAQKCTEDKSPGTCHYKKECSLSDDECGRCNKRCLEEDEDEAASCVQNCQEHCL